MTVTTVAKAGELKPGEIKVIEVAGRKIAVANVDGAFYAFDDACTHDNGPLAEGEVMGDAIECPRHGARFDMRTGKALTLPAVLPLKMYPVRIENGEIRVEV